MFGYVAFYVVILKMWLLLYSWCHHLSSFLGVPNGLFAGVKGVTRSRWVRGWSALEMVQITERNIPLDGTSHVAPTFMMRHLEMWSCVSLDRKHKLAPGWSLLRSSEESCNKMPAYPCLTSRFPNLLNFEFLLLG